MIRVRSLVQHTLFDASPGGLSMTSTARLSDEQLIDELRCLLRTASIQWTIIIVFANGSISMGKHEGRD